MDFTLTKGAKCAVVGYGSWATAIVKILTESNCKVGWYVRNPEILDSLINEGRNPRYLPNIKFDCSRICPSEDINKVVSEADIVIMAAPSAYLKEFLKPLNVSLKDKFVVSAIKGIIPGEYLTIIEYLAQHYDLSLSQLGIITGPTHAEEVALEHLSYITVVCQSQQNAALLGEHFLAKYVKLSYSTDLYGVEYAAILKNIYAIAVGMASGLGYGDNFLAVLISNSAMELSRFLNESAPYERNTRASAYLGDLLVTCYSIFSRNRRLGNLIGRGCSVKSALNEMTMVAEGYFAANCLRHLNLSHRIELPIADMVYDVLYNGASARIAMKNLTSKLV